MRLFTTKSLLFAIISSLNLPLWSQSFEIQSPLEIPLYLSGNFAELRSTHFHAGIDIKTLGEVGQNVHVVAPGYVSRVKIQTGGYGHSIYITHSNGYTSVYAHMNEFFPELEQFVKNEQYRTKKYEVDLQVEKGKYSVVTGQIIGLSGNTGSSGGPHLHLEIRDKNEVPLNVLKFNLPILDTISPVFRNLYVYKNIDSQTFQCTSKVIIPISGNSGKYSIQKPIEVSESTGFGIEVYDFLNGSQNKCGIYSLDFVFDDKLIHSVKFDQVSFEEAGYIKTYCDYSERVLNGNGIHRLFVEPNNKLSVYKTSFGNGILFIHDSILHKGKIIATDAYGNKSELNFTAYSKTGLNRLAPDSNNIFLYYNRENNIVNSTMKFKIPAGSLYSDKSVNFSSSPKGKGYFSNTYKIGDELIPMNTFPTLSLKLSSDSIELNKDKLIIVRIDTTGDVSSEGGAYANGWITAKVTGFGKYVVAEDTISPTVTPISFQNNNRYASGNTLSFRIEDELSGIKTYNGYIDNEWALFEYDAKSDSLYYKIDQQRLLRKNTPHSLEIFVMDERNNIKKFFGNFYF